MVPALGSGQAWSVSFLWAQHNEHRLPLAKLIWLVISHASRYDFRAAMYLSALTLGAAAALLLFAAKRVRGQTSYADAFLALTLLNLGQCQNLLWSFLLSWTLSSLFLAVVFMVVVMSGQFLRIKDALIAGSAIICLPLCGGNGVIVAPCLALWLGWSAFRQWRKPGFRMAGTIALSFTIMALLTCCLYFVNYNWRGASSHAFSPLVLASATAQCLAISMGRGACGIDDSGRKLLDAVCFGPAVEHWKFLVIFMLVCLALAFGSLAWAAYRCAEERHRSIALIVFACAVLAVAPVVAWGRASSSSPYECLHPRYIVICLPLWWVVYFSGILCRWNEAANLLQISLFSVACAFFLTNECTGLEYGRWQKAAMKRFEDALDRGVPCPLLANEADCLYPRVDVLPARFSMLRRAGVGPFRHMNDPEYVEVKLPTTPTCVEHLVAAKEGWHVQGPDAGLVYRLPCPRRVEAVRVRVIIHNGGTAVMLRCCWADSTRNQLVDVARAYERTLPTTRASGARVLTVPINDRIDLVRISAGTKPCDVQVQEVVLLCSDSPTATAYFHDNARRRGSLVAYDR
jgi:hypothetical protein